MAMNLFAALIILSTKPLHDFFDLVPEGRIFEFGHLVAQERLVIIVLPLHILTHSLVDSVQ